MDSPDGTASSQLCGADERSFEKGLHAVCREWEQAGDSSRLAGVLRELGALAATRSLGSSEISRRARLTVEAARLTDVQLRVMASALGTFPPAVKQAVIAALPAGLRRLAYAPQPENSVADSAPAGASPARPEAAPDQLNGSDPARPCANVILLGTYADHEENLRTLERRGFSALRATTIEQLAEYLDRDVCGIVVSRSWWASLPVAAHDDAIRRILTHSSFAWIKLDSESLPFYGNRLHELLLSIRHSEPQWDDCVCHDGCRLTAHDLDALERVRGILSSSEAVRLCPAEIHDSQARILIGAAIKHVRRRNHSAGFQLSRVDANLIHGGRSAARIIRVVPDDDGAPFVAKMDDPCRLNDEMDRFRRYAQRWDTQLNPQLHYHAGTSLILFGLLDSPTTPGVPAPTVEETFESIYYHEHYPPYAGPSEADTRELISRTISKLRQLNALRNDGACERRIAIECQPFDRLREAGLRWHVGHPGRVDETVFELTAAASNRVAEMADQAIVHGDVQLRNILVRDGREPHLIDYANCGPGHPCFDLVRLESAVLYYCFRMHSDESALAALLQDILLGRDESEICSAHPLFCRSVTNRLAIHTCIACRAAAIELAGIHGGTEDDYLAMKLVLACQSLFLIHLQAGVVRGQLCALNDVLRRRTL
ncbi:phosphotransferase [Tautonia sp. JC769]|uniref:phosphotransferase family protein n=1 Tax=Tautonia sp. JC769 TaxID=3232135 RepID=UPI0034599B2E